MQLAALLVQALPGEPRIDFAALQAIVWQRGIPDRVPAAGPDGPGRIRGCLHRRRAFAANGPTITYPLFRMINALSDGLLIALILLVGALVVAIAFLCIRFTLLAKIEDDYREIGVMKAIGLRVSDIKQNLPDPKYVAICLQRAACSGYAPLLRLPGLRCLRTSACTSGESAERLPPPLLWPHFVGHPAGLPGNHRAICERRAGAIPEDPRVRGPPLRGFAGESAAGRGVSDMYDARWLRREPFPRHQGRSRQEEACTPPCSTVLAHLGLHHHRPAEPALPRSPPASSHHLPGDRGQRSPHRHPAGRGHSRKGGGDRPVALADGSTPWPSIRCPHHPGLHA
ncbi:MAG: ABC transporter permease [Desulfosudis oleivorans]|nr:ABC transporter permease [Desulfosudis oleivorans]